MTFKLLEAKSEPGQGFDYSDITAITKLSMPIDSTTHAIYSRGIESLAHPVDPHSFNDAEVKTLRACAKILGPVSTFFLCFGIPSILSYFLCGRRRDESPRKGLPSSLSYFLDGRRREEIPYIYLSSGPTHASGRYPLLQTNTYKH